MRAGGHPETIHPKPLSSHRRRDGAVRWIGLPEIAQWASKLVPQDLERPVRRYKVPKCLLNNRKEEHLLNSTSSNVGQLAGRVSCSVYDSSVGTGLQGARAATSQPRWVSEFTRTWRSLCLGGYVPHWPVFCEGTIWGFCTGQGGYGILLY